MTPAEVADILRQFNEWRRSDYEPSEQPEPLNPYEVGLAIDEAVELLDRLEATERERDALRAKVEAMEQQEPVGKAGAMPGTSGFTMACFRADAVPFGSKLYAIPGAKGE